jgi:demethylmenaquinone methyltransferase/2-methoxy-6-polyprenyl-1,4-benzoquinol methylase
MDDKTFHVMRNYNRLSRWYDLLSGSGEFSVVKKTVSLLDIKPGDKVLEIGCGTGKASGLLRKDLVSMNKMVSLDLSAGMLMVAQRKMRKKSHHRQYFVQADAAHLPLQENTFNAAFSTFTMEILTEDARFMALSSIFRVLEEGGYFCAAVISNQKNKNFVMLIYNYLRLKFPHIIDCQPIDLVIHLKATGFKVISSKIVFLWSIPVEIILAQKVPGGIE